MIAVESEIILKTMLDSVAFTFIEVEFPPLKTRKNNFLLFVLDFGQIYSPTSNFYHTIYAPRDEGWRIKDILQKLFKGGKES